MGFLKKLKVWQLLIGVIVVVGGGILFVVAVSGGFDGLSKAEVSTEYRCEGECDGEYIELSPDEYSKLIADKKSFVVLVDQGGCKTADMLKGFVKDFATEKGIKVLRIMFEDMKKTSLHDTVKYYPSVVVVSNGKVTGFLRADSDEDADAYNKYEDFEAWINKYLK